MIPELVLLDVWLDSVTATTARTTIVHNKQIYMKNKANCFIAKQKQLKNGTKTTLLHHTFLQSHKTNNKYNEANFSLQDKQNAYINNEHVSKEGAEAACIRSKLEKYATVCIMRE